MEAPKGAVDMVHVLVIAPDAAVRETLRFLLEDEGYGVSEAPNVESGLESLRQSRRAMVVLSDAVPFGARTPHMGESELMDRALHDASLAGRHAYVLLTTSPERLSEGQRCQAQHLGAAIVAMPFEVDELLAIVARAAHRLSAA
jgi:CheY-like chemotaxis protein